MFATIFIFECNNVASLKWDVMCVIYHVVCAAGPLTQWQLIFYGTETPPQEYDASPESNSLGTNAGVGSTAWKSAAETESIEEVRQNAIDDDLALVWHDSHAVSSVTLLFSCMLLLFAIWLSTIYSLSFPIFSHYNLVSDLRNKQLLSVRIRYHVYCIVDKILANIQNGYDHLFNQLLK